MNKLKISPQQLFETSDHLINNYVRSITNNKSPLSKELHKHKKLLEEIMEKVKKTNTSLSPHAMAQKKKAENILLQLEKKMIKAQKQKLKTEIGQIRNLRQKLFPEGQMQERQESFIPYYLKYGEAFFHILKKESDPFKNKVIVLTAI